MSASSSPVEPGLRLWGGALLVAALLAAGCRHEAPAAVGTPVPTPAPSESFYDLDEFLVNLSGSQSESYLRTTLSLGYTHASQDDRIKKMVPKIRDAIIDVLAQESPATLSSEAGRAKVKAELLARVQALVPSAGFDGVYFQLFTFQ